MVPESPLVPSTALPLSYSPPPPVLEEKPLKKAIILGDGECPTNFGHQIDVLPQGGPQTCQFNPIEATKEEPATEMPHGPEDFSAFVIVKPSAMSGNQETGAERVPTPQRPNPVVRPAVIGATVNRRR